MNSVILEAYKGAALLNERMEGGFAVPKPGNNLFRLSDDVSRRVIRPNGRYLQ